VAKAFEATSVTWPDTADARAEGRSLLAQWRPVLCPVLTCIAYYLGSQIGFALTFRPHPVSVLWPANSILLAALLLTPIRGWGAVLLGAFPAHCLVQLQTHIPIGMMLCYFVSNSCEAVIGAGCIRHFLAGPVRFDSLRSTSIFCLYGGLLAPFLSSFLDAGFVQLNHWGAGTYWELWRIRFSSNVLSALTFAPAVLTWFASPLLNGRSWRRKEFFEAILLFFGLAATTYATFYKVGPSPNPTLFLAPLPFLLWAALRLGPRGTTNAILTVTFLAIWSAAHGHGPFTADTPEQNARSLQMFLIVMAIPFLFLAAGIEERAAAEERFTNAFRASPDPISITRVRDAIVLDVNERWLAMFRYDRAEVIGRSLFDLKFYSSPEDRARLIGLTAGDGALRDFESSVRDKNGTSLCVELSGVRADVGGEPCLIITTRDITDRKRAEEADLNLVHAARLAALGQLSASIAHEINQPLGAILSNADAAEMLLESDSPPLDELRKIVADIRSDDIRASETIGHIRMLTRKRTTQLNPVNLHDLIMDVVRLVAPDARQRRVSLEMALTAPQCTVLGDRVQLQQAVMNLILNGMESMAETAATGRDLVVRTVEKSPEQIEIAVSDLGRGIPPDKISRLFESFFTTKENGVGLGLAVVRSIVDAHHGSISAENNPGGGATFRLVLPLVTTESSSP
jgi:PAS domain S-box-containing protein